MSTQLRVVLIGLALCFTGCSDKLQVAEVTGVVTLDGKPLELVQVEFWPTNGRAPSAKPTPRASSLWKRMTERKKGAVPGKHKVALRDTWPSKDDYISDGGDWVDMSKGKKSRIDSKYYDPPTSPLSVDVESGKTNNFEFKVDPRK